MDAYVADSSLKGKLRRRLTRLTHRRPMYTRLDRPMITFSFDDAPASAARTGAAMLEARGLRGTYYISAGMIGGASEMGQLADERDIRRLHTVGHEIGCHTLMHLDCAQTAPLEIDRDVAANGRALADLGAPVPQTFAYPYGDVSPEAKQILAPRFFLLRALHHGLVELGADLNQAPAVGIEGEDGPEIAGRWLERAIARRSWLILYTHDVRDAPSPWGCTPAALERLIDRALAADVEIVTAAEGCRLIGPG